MQGSSKLATSARRRCFSFMMSMTSSSLGLSPTPGVGDLRAKYTHLAKRSGSL
jgi:hypothetical protein